MAINGALFMPYAMLSALFIGRDLGLLSRINSSRMALALSSSRDIVAMVNDVIMAMDDGVN